MAGTTTNNGWTYPTSTDLVKDGATAIQTLADGIDTSTGKGLIAWQAYTPTFTGYTVGNATTTFVYCKIGKTVHVKGISVLGTTSVMTGNVEISLPVASTGYTVVGQQPSGVASFYSGSLYFYGFLVYLGSTGTFRIQVANVAGTYLAGNDLTTVVPFAWATPAGKFLACQFTYECA
jgi:hypothetical protein